MLAWLTSQIYVYRLVSDSEWYIDCAHSVEAVHLLFLMKAKKDVIWLMFILGVIWPDCLLLDLPDNHQVVAVAAVAQCRCCRLPDHLSCECTATAPLSPCVVLLRSVSVLCQLVHSTSVFQHAFCWSACRSLSEPVSLASEHDVVFFLPVHFAD